MKKGHQRWRSGGVPRWSSDQAQELRELEQRALDHPHRPIESTPVAAGAPFPRDAECIRRDLEQLRGDPETYAFASVRLVQQLKRQDGRPKQALT